MIDIGDGTLLRPEAVDGVKQFPVGFAQAAAEAVIYLRGGQTIRTFESAASIVAKLEAATEAARAEFALRNSVTPC